MVETVGRVEMELCGLPQALVAEVVVVAQTLAMRRLKQGMQAFLEIMALEQEVAAVVVVDRVLQSTRATELRVQTVSL